MRKHVGVPLALLLVLICVGVSFATFGKGDAENATVRPVITIDTLRMKGELERSSVPFPHDSHTAAMKEEGCLLCHDKASDETGPSFPYKNTNELGFDEAKDLYHDTCIACHAEREAKNLSTGPQICSECHINGAQEMVAKPRSFDPVLHATHTGAAIVEEDENSCLVCHSEAPAAGSAQGMPARSLNKESHALCVTCHLDLLEKGAEKSGPVLCAGCHTGADSKPAAIPESMRLMVGQPDVAIIGDAKMTNKGRAGTKLVAFNHKAHELSGVSCSSCHPETDSRESFIKPETAMHSDSNGLDCAACHNESKKAAECAGCHAVMPENKASDDASCVACHSIDSANGKHLPKGKSLERMMAKRRSAHDSGLRKKAPETVTIDVLAKKFQPSVFPHKVMVDALAKGLDSNPMANAFHGSDAALCLGCHHNAPATENPAKCASCHSVTRTKKSKRGHGRPDLTGAYHQQCMGCHDTMNVTLDDGCRACHASLTTDSKQ